MDADYLRDLFASFGPITIRSMFGGQGLYADGLIFGLIVDDEIYLKADKETAPLFEAEGSRPFTYEGKAKPVVMPYWRLPDAAMDDPDAVALWARRAREVAVRSSVAGRKAKPPRAAKGSTGHA